MSASDRRNCWMATGAPTLPVNLPILPGAERALPECLDKSERIDTDGYLPRTVAGLRCWYRETNMQWERLRAALLYRERDAKAAARAYSCVPNKAHSKVRVQDGQGGWKICNHGSHQPQTLLLEEHVFAVTL